MLSARGRHRRTAPCLVGRRRAAGSRGRAPARAAARDGRRSTARSWRSPSQRSLLCAVLFGLVPALTASSGALAPALKEGGRSGSACPRQPHTPRVRGRRSRARAGAAGWRRAAGSQLRASCSTWTRASIRRGIVTMTVSLSGLAATASRRSERSSSSASSIGSRSCLASRPPAAPASCRSMAWGRRRATKWSASRTRRPARSTSPTFGSCPRTTSRRWASRCSRGRLFDESDKGDITNRVIINETMARRHWPGQDPIGQKVRIAWNDTRDDEVIGVVGDVRHQGLDAQPRAMTYWPHPRFP